MGHVWGFAVCMPLTSLWAASGSVFDYSQTWQLIINTGTTFAAFLMVFMIQTTQNRDGVAIQAKLDELVRAGEGKSDLIGIEHLTGDEVQQIRVRISSATGKSRSEH
ncbi:MAG: low affinity iron permease family protein [Mesorhizobium sp.]|nr:MAG: low affinity iron permease family protein [Mesorhizobium sp.]